MKRAILLLPFRLQRSGANHQHARDIVISRQELASRNGLDGLAQAHLVCEQRTLCKGKMQHAFALIG